MTLSLGASVHIGGVVGVQRSSQSIQSEHPHARRATKPVHPLHSACSTRRGGGAKGEGELGASKRPGAPGASKDSGALGAGQDGGGASADRGSAIRGV
jgi:hypothetical protein